MTNIIEVKAILFDLDGTLIDTARDFVRIIKEMAKEHGFTVPSDEEIREQVSAGSLAMVSLFQNMDDDPDNLLTNEQIEEYRQEFLQRYEDNICVKSRIYRGINPFLTELDKQGIAWGVVTNKPRHLSEKLLEAFELTDSCSVLVCPEDVTNNKPDPEPLHLALDILGIDRTEASSVIYIGDHVRDIEAGNSAGMSTIIAGYGYISDEEQEKLDTWHADTIVNTSQALVTLLKNCIKQGKKHSADKPVETVVEEKEVTTTEENTDNKETLNNETIAEPSDDPFVDNNDGEMIQQELDIDNEVIEEVQKTEQDIAEKEILDDNLTTDDKEREEVSKKISIKEYIDQATQENIDQSTEHLYNSEQFVIHNAIDNDVINDESNANQAVSTNKESIMTESVYEQVLSYYPSEKCLDGKVILITGAGDGIGRVMAINYARYGATVLLLGKTLSKLEYVYDEIENFGGKQPAMLPMNLATASYGEMQTLAKKIEEEFGQLDGIVHNAGILGDLSTLEDSDVESFQEVMQINFTAPFMLTKALYGALRRSEQASVLFTSSGVTNPLRPYWGAYTLSKQGVESLCTIFNQEAQNNEETAHIRFNTIDPGATRTAMRAKAYPDEDPMTLKVPEDIIPTYIYFMSDDSKHVNGEIVHLPSIKHEE